MIYPVYALRDKAAEAFLAPTINSNDQTAKRDLSMAVNGQSGSMSYKPADFDLYHIGTYDVESGQLVPVSPVRFVCNAGELVIDDG